jgi:dUTP pyrophosphatase
VLEVKLLRPGARLPLRATAGASGLDLFACPEYPGYVELNQDVSLIPTGIALAAPPGCDVQIRPRSGLALQGVEVVFGTIDSDYRGEVFVSMRTFGSRRSYRVQEGDRIAQLVVGRVELLGVVAVDELSASGRGPAGHGSTGR